MTGTGSPSGIGRASALVASMVTEVDITESDPTGRKDLRFGSLAVDVTGGEGSPRGPGWARRSSKIAVTEDGSMDGYRAAATLLVSRDADQDEIRRAFRARAKELHPDTGLNGSESAFVELREAFDQLMATAPAPRQLENLTVPPRARTAARFDVRSTAAGSNRLDVTDTSRRVRPAARRGAVDPDERARGLNFSRHLADSLTAMTNGSVPHAVAS